MTQMTQKIGIFAAGLAVPAAILRALELQNGYDPTNGIPVAYYPARLAIWALAAVVLVLAWVLSAPLDKDTRSYEVLYGDPSMARKTTAVVAAFLMIIGGALGIMYTLTSGQLYKIDLQTMRPTLDLVGALTLLGLWLVALITGVSYLCLLKARKSPMTATSAIWTTVPIYWAGFNLIVTYKETSVSPFVTRYALDLAVATCLILAAYFHASLLYGKPKLRLFVVFAALGIFFGVTSLGEAVMSLQHAELYTAASTNAIYRSLCFVAASLWLVHEFPTAGQPAEIPAV